MRHVLAMLIACLGLVLFAPDSVNAQFFGGYGAGFAPSPQALYSPYNGAVTGAVYPSGFVQGSGYMPPPPIYNGGYGMCNGGYRRMPLVPALATAAILTYGINRNYGYGYSSYGYGGGYRGFHHHHHHHR